MSKVRFIGTSSSDGSLNSESITFTEDFEVEAKDYCKPGHAVYCDKVIEMEIPTMFPLEHTFER